MPTHLPGYPVQDGSDAPCITGHVARGRGPVILGGAVPTFCAGTTPHTPGVTIMSASHPTPGTTLAQTVILPAQAGRLGPKCVESCHHRLVPASVMVC